MGHPAAIEDTIQQMRKHRLVLKVEDNLRDYLLCDIVLLDDHLRAWLGQPYLIAKLEDCFGEEVKKISMTLTQGLSGQHQV